MDKGKNTFGTPLKVFLAVFLFAIAFAIRIPLVDTYYEYSFEADSQRCVDITRSFYFFFKNPCLENAPQTLDAYPNYSDGQYISASLLANIFRPLCKAGIITVSLSDSDNKLIIFSMRWCGVVFDAGAVMFSFLALCLLTQQIWISFLVCLFYYLLNVQTLSIDLIRIDHYTLFTATFAMWSSLRLYFGPAQKKNYLLSAIGTGLVSATKINFPFYLFITASVFAVLFYRKKVERQNFGLWCLAFLLTFAFMYQRWLMYPENILDVLKITLNTGEDWVKFWGNDNYFYYLWGQFFNHDFSWKILQLLLLFYLSFVYILFQIIKRRNGVYLMLCIIFILQMLALMFSPKVGRYGLIMPIWVSIFIALFLTALSNKIKSRFATTGICVLLLLPSFTYAVRDYIDLAKSVRHRATSIAETRMAAYNWIKGNALPGSIIAVQHPQVSNPPVFDLPYFINYRLFQFPFLYKDSLCRFRPPNFSELKGSVNYIILNDKEVNYHLSTLQHHACDTTIIRRWRFFFDSLATYFPEKSFSSVYENYGVRNFRVFIISDTIQKKVIPLFQLNQKLSGEQMELCWDYKHRLGAGAHRFQIQIAEDSAMQWLIYGSRVGDISKYRLANTPAQIEETAPSCIPMAIHQALNKGRFNKVLQGVNPKEIQSDFQNFFADILVNMVEKHITFGEGITQALNEINTEFSDVIKAIYEKEGDILTAYAPEYLKMTGLEITEQQVTDSVLYFARWKFIPPLHFEPGKNYYWRVRFKDKENVRSTWSKVCPLKQ